MAGLAKGLVFQRIEKKYMLSQEQYEGILEEIAPYMAVDEYGLSKICNIYFDTETDELVRSSNEKPLYKEKFRLRSYGIPGQEDRVYLEIKRKYNGIVYKRRISLTLREAEDYLLRGVRPEKDSQILREIDYFLKFYQPKPKLYLAYDRTAWYGRQDGEFRMTFDSNIRSRRDHLSLGFGDEAELLYDYAYQLLEIKAAGAYPLWLTRALTRLGIYPVSFSKYGTIYQKEQAERAILQQAAVTLEEGVLGVPQECIPENIEWKGEQKQCLPV
ncbi:MAG: polyphosphate polymerase domain-containing protein [Lachnospiraceae bacterium]|nr:polyphosphate polymerase domain-containing protein [Lachnospiraceae bacterium]